MTYRIYKKPDSGDYYGIQVNDKEQIVHAVQLCHEDIHPLIQEDMIRRRIGMTTYGYSRSLGVSLQSSREWS